MSVRIMAGVWEAAPVRSGELLVLLALADHANDHGTCFPSVPRLAERARLSLRQTQRVLRHLERRGMIARKPHGGRRGTDLFTVNMSPPEPSKRDEGVTVMCDESDDTHDAKGACQMSPGTVIEPSKNPPIVPKGDFSADDFELLGRAKALMRKRPTTALDEAERRAWLRARRIVKDTSAEEWTMLEAYYTAPISKRNDFRRRQLCTLLNNWSGEISKARNWSEDHGTSFSSSSAPPEPEPSGWLDTLHRLHPEAYTPKTFADLRRDYPDIAAAVLQHITETKA